MTKQWPVAVFISMALSSTALAQEDGPSAHWYGYQAALVAAGARALALGSAAAVRTCAPGADRRCQDDRTAGWLAVSALGAYGLGAPLVHGLHGEWAHVAGSLTLRAAPFLVAAELGGPWPDAGRTILIGMAAAMIIDDGWLARSRPRVMVLPAWDPTTRSRALMLARGF